MMLWRFARSRMAYVASGPTVTPSWIDAGAGANALSNPTPDYPATNAAGDLFVLHVYCNTGSASTPSGWTLQNSSTDGVVITYVFTRDTRSAGSESGTLAVTGTGSAIQARIHAYRNVATSAFVTGGATATSGSSTLSMPTVVAGGNARLAVSFIGCNSDSGMGSSTGESGGDWVESVAELTSGLGCGMQNQHAALATGGTLSGGSMSHGGSRAVCVAFALVGT